jgi:predicted amidohydrolase
MIIALASPRVASSLEDGLQRMDRLIADASRQSARIVCLPEAYLPGLRGQDFRAIDWNADEERKTIDAVADIARRHHIAVIFSLERVTAAGRMITACVIDAAGNVVGFQDKTQLDPSEDRYYIPGNSRRLFEIDGVKFGIVICHEGWRYPETVRWAAARGASIVFHPQHTGNETHGMTLTEWGAADSPYYEKAMMMRSIENGVWFASVNYALRYQEAATTIIDPSGRCHAFLPYGEEGVLVRDIDPGAATGHLAARFAPDRYREATD